MEEKKVLLQLEKCWRHWLYRAISFVERFIYSAKWNEITVMGWGGVGGLKSF